MGLLPLHEAEVGKASIEVGRKCKALLDEDEGVGPRRARDGWVGPPGAG